MTNVTFMTNFAYQYSRSPVFQDESIVGLETNITYLPPLPQLYLLTANRLQTFMFDGNHHIIDYAQFNGPNNIRNLNAEIQTFGVAQSYANMWTTNTTASGASIAIQNQILASEDSSSIPLNSTYWNGQNTPPSYQIDGFYYFMTGNNTLPLPLVGASATNQFKGYVTNLIHQTPFTPTVTASIYTTWQANDPLVHYLASDLNFSESDSSPATGLSTNYLGATNFFGTLPNIGQLNDHYLPWGKSRTYVGSDNTAYNFAYKDSLVTNSDAWDFPANKFPTVGWLGRVHRGTPWQTVFLKATNFLNSANGLATWTNLTGSQNSFDAVNTAPVQDRLLFDVFSTAPNNNATRGQLSVNQDHLAAWSAVLSGIVVPTSLTNSLPAVIAPAGLGGVANSTLGQLVAAINNTRLALTNTDGLTNTFEHVGDILRTPQLTEQSSFLTGLSPQTQISDELYEWLPQQVMSLLDCPGAPRYVIYSYGQTLAPAPNGIVTGGGSFFGMVTNYQVMSEIATRAVVRVEDAKTPHPHIVVESYNILPPD
jgi:hypothetical protein